MKTSAVVIPIPPQLEVRRILYATDFSEASRAALPLVSVIARHYGSHVYIAYICSPLGYCMMSPAAVSTLEGMQDKSAKQEADSIAASELAGVPATVIIQPGDPVEELSRIVYDQNIDLTILSTHGLTGWKHLVMGSVAEALFRQLTCPVLTIGPCFSKWFSEESRIKSILFPTDLSKESGTVFPYLASISSEFRSDVTLLHVLPEGAGTSHESTILAEALRRQVEAAFFSQISPRCHKKVLVEFGDPAKSILTVAERLNVDLIGLEVRRAMSVGTHLRSTIAYKVVLGANCPVLSCKLAEDGL